MTLNYAHRRGSVLYLCHNSGMMLNYAHRFGFVLYMCHKSQMTLSYANRIWISFSQGSSRPESRLTMRTDSGYPSSHHSILEDIKLSVATRQATDPHTTGKIVKLCAPIRNSTLHIWHVREDIKLNVPTGSCTQTVRDDHRPLLRVLDVPGYFKLRVTTLLPSPPTLQRTEPVLELSYTCQKTGTFVS